jgi:hypothetical protein
MTEPRKSLGDKTLKELSNNDLITIVLIIFTLIFTITSIVMGQFGFAAVACAILVHSMLG